MIQIHIYGIPRIARHTYIYACIICMHARIPAYVHIEKESPLTRHPPPPTHTHTPPYTPPSIARAPAASPPYTHLHALTRTYTPPTLTFPCFRQLTTLTTHRHSHRPRQRHGRTPTRVRLLTTACPSTMRAVRARQTATLRPLTPAGRRATCLRRKAIPRCVCVCARVRVYPPACAGRQYSLRPV